MNNRKKSWAENRLLIDTTFILPALGVDVEEEAYEAIGKFEDYKIFYLEVSLLEAMWSILKRVEFGDSSTVKIGLEAVRDTYSRIEVSAGHFIKAWEIYTTAHRDFIDDLLYSVSLTEGIPLLTLDKKLAENLKGKGYPTKNILFPENLR